MGTKHLAVIAGEDDEGVLGEAEVVQRLEDAPDPVVDLADESVVVGDHVADLVRIAVFRHSRAAIRPTVRRVGHGIGDAGWRLDGLDGVHAVVRGSRQDGRVGEVEGRRDAEWCVALRGPLQGGDRATGLIGGHGMLRRNLQAAMVVRLRASLLAGPLARRQAIPAIQRIDGVGATVLGQLLARAEFAPRHMLIELGAEGPEVVQPVPAIRLAVHTELPVTVGAVDGHVPFAVVFAVVATVGEQLVKGLHGAHARVAPDPGQRVRAHTMVRHRATGQNGGSGGRAHRALCIGLAEPCPITGQPVHIRRLQHGIARDAECIVALLVSHDEEQIRALVPRRTETWGSSQTDRTHS